MIGARFDEATQRAIEALCAEEMRTPANALKFIVSQWFREHRPDLLTPPTKEEMTAEVRKAMGLPEKP